MSPALVSTLLLACELTIRLCVPQGMGTPRVRWTYGQTQERMGGGRKVSTGPITFEKKRHEGDDGGGELGEEQSIDSVVP